MINMASEAAAVAGFDGDGFVCERLQDWLAKPGNSQSRLSFAVYKHQSQISLLVHSGRAIYVLSDRKGAPQALLELRSLGASNDDRYKTLGYETA